MLAAPIGGCRVKSDVDYRRVTKTKRGEAGEFLGRLPLIQEHWQKEVAEKIRSIQALRCGTWKSNWRTGNVVKSTGTYPKFPQQFPPIFTSNFLKPRSYQIPSSIQTKTKSNGSEKWIGYCHDPRNKD